MPAARAAQLAMKAIFDYGDVSRVSNWLRRSGVAPFITFPLKATAALGPAMVTDTGRFASLMKAMKAPGYALAPEEIPAERAAMPDWMADQSMRLPMKTKEGETYYQDVAYMLPWGPWAEGMSLMPLQLYPIPRILEDIARNQSAFTGRPIYDPDTPETDKLLARLEYMKDALGPGWIVRGLPRIAAAVRGRPRYRYGAEPAVPSVPATVAGELAGLRTQTISPTRGMRVRYAQLRAETDKLTDDIRRLQRRQHAGEITPQQADRLIQFKRLRMKLLREDFQGRQAVAFPQAAG